MEIFSLLPLNFHATNDDAYDALARHLSALKNALVALDVYIKTVDSRLRASAPSVISVASNYLSSTRQTRSTVTRSSRGPLPASAQYPLPPFVPPIFPYPAAFTAYGHD